MLPDNFSPMTGAASPNRFGGLYGGKDQHGRAARGRVGGDGALPVGQTGWHRKHAVRALRQHEPVGLNGVEAPRERSRKYGATIKDALTALWEASDRVCGKRLKVMIPILLPALEQHGRLKLGLADRDRVLAISPPKGIVRPRMGSV